LSANQRGGNRNPSVFDWFTYLKTQHKVFVFQKRDLMFPTKHGTNCPIKSERAGKLPCFVERFNAPELQSGLGYGNRAKKAG